MERALIFAAGRGERMRPLTDTTPKPLLPIRGKPMIVRHLEALARAGVTEVVINTSHLAAQFPEALGDGSQWNLRIRYSYEGPEPLDSGGGMLRAVPFLGHDPFIAVNGDIVTDFDFSTLPRDPKGVAHLVVIDNPPHNSNGDFVLRDGRLHDELTPRSTFAGIGVYRPSLLDGHTGGTFSMVPILREAMRRGDVTGEQYRGAWTDVGTPQRLADINGALSAPG
ncbi:MAG TPA: nucleotidyltransferase family protein [Rudaea sp.]|nr:nucleotidyltransferase family protein [Rudaea sp.]